VRTATQVFPHTLRFANFVAGSETMLSFDAGKCGRMLENYVVGGERVVEPDRAGTGGFSMRSARACATSGWRRREPPGALRGPSSRSPTTTWERVGTLAL